MFTSSPVCLRMVTIKQSTYQQRSTSFMILFVKLVQKANSKIKVLAGVGWKTMFSFSAWHKIWWLVSVKWQFVHRNFIRENKSENICAFLHRTRHTSGQGADPKPDQGSHLQSDAWLVCHHRMTCERDREDVFIDQSHKIWSVWCWAGLWLLDTALCLFP